MLLKANPRYGSIVQCRELRIASSGAVSAQHRCDPALMEPDTLNLGCRALLMQLPLRTVPEVDAFQLAVWVSPLGMLEPG